MKNTQIEWIGCIPDDWEVKPISACFKERNEKVSDYEWEPLSVTKQGIVKQLETAAKSDAHDARKKVCKNDFVINSRSDRKQSCGVSAYDGSVSLINIVLENKKLNSKFVNYLLKNYGFAEEFYRYGSGIVADLWSTNYQKMKKIMIPIPPNDEQEKIAGFLDEKIQEIDNIIEKTKETIEDYKKYKQLVITEVVTKGLKKNSEMKDGKSEWIGLIPKEWDSLKLKYVGKFISGYAFPSNAFINDGVIAMKITNIQPGRIDWSELSYVDNEWYDKLEKYRVEKDDVVFALTRPIINGGIKTAIMTENKKVLLNQRNAMFKKNNRMLSKWLFFVMQNLRYVEEFKLNIDFTGLQPNISSFDIENIKIPLPKIKIQEEIIQYLNNKCLEIETLIKKKKEVIIKLEQYKKSLIYEYVTGKKQVI